MRSFYTTNILRRARDDFHRELNVQCCFCMSVFFHVNKCLI